MRVEAFPDDSRAVTNQPPDPHGDAMPDFHVYDAHNPADQFDDLTPEQRLLHDIFTARDDDDEPDEQPVTVDQLLDIYATEDFDATALVARSSDDDRCTANNIFFALERYHALTPAERAIFDARTSRPHG